MMTQNNCLYCYGPVEPGLSFHPKCSRNFFGSPEPPEVPYALNEMESMAKQVIQRSVSVPGVQAKISMALRNENLSKSRLTVVGIPDGQYIFKPPSAIYPEMPANEHLTMRIAEAAGIRVVPSSLIRMKSGELSYITKRIDRTAGGGKIHMLDMFQITEAFDKYKSSHEKAGKAVHNYSGNTLLDKLRLFELVLFCYLTGNNDMHLKNFSLIESANGWELAPAYDLLNVAIANPEDTEELALTLDGRKKRLTRDNFLNFGTFLNLNNKQIHGAFKRLSDNKTKDKANNLIDISFLSTGMKQAYRAVMEKRYKVLEGQG